MTVDDLDPPMILRRSQSANSFTSALTERRYSPSLSALRASSAVRFFARDPGCRQGRQDIGRTIFFEPLQGLAP